MREGQKQIEPVDTRRGDPGCGPAHTFQSCAEESCRRGAQFSRPHSGHPGLGRLRENDCAGVAAHRDRSAGLRGTGFCAHLARRAPAPRGRRRGRNIARLSCPRCSIRCCRRSGSTSISWMNRVWQAPTRCANFLPGLAPHDRVLLIGDTRQHQGVEAGRPFEQLQQAGMHTAKLDEIVRQKDPSLKSAVELLAHGQTAAALDRFTTGPRSKEIPNPQERIRTIARIYAESPANTLIVSPDNASRRELNFAVRQELKASGAVARRRPQLSHSCSAPRHDGSRPRLGQPLRNRRRGSLRSRQQDHGNRGRFLWGRRRHQSDREPAHCRECIRRTCHLRSAPPNRGQRLSGGSPTNSPSAIAFSSPRRTNHLASPIATLP